jgi:tetratricopeptide (TPR) repeat protein
MSDRLAAAREYVAKKPADRFGLYALAMELRKTKAWEECFATFDRLLVHHPDYGAAWFHYGMARKESGDRAAAAETWRRGLDACVRSNDTKTRAEIQGALDELEDE